MQQVHSIETLIGHKLDEFQMEEAEVLKGITKVNLEGYVLCCVFGSYVRLHSMSEQIDI
jgi:hypothetical protein